MKKLAIKVMIDILLWITDMQVLSVRSQCKFIEELLRVANELDQRRAKDDQHRY